MENTKLALLGLLATYLLYVNMKNENTIVNKSETHIQADITTEKKPIKEGVPIIAQEQPKPPKPIAIPQNITPISNIKYDSKQGFINHRQIHHYGQPRFRTFQNTNYM
jgi:hypothetical protein